MDSDYKVETPTTDSTPTASQSHKDEPTMEPPQQTNSSSTHKPYKKRNQSKKKNKKPYRPAYLDFIQQEIDDMKQKARHTYEIQARQNLEGELIDDEKLVAEQRMATSSLIDKLEELKVKLDTPDMLRRSGEDFSASQSLQNNRAKENTTAAAADFQQETLTLLHFFYIVRLAQKGFFTVISQKYPKVEPNALIHLCDMLVGSSLFVVKDPKENVRSTKRNQVFDLLRKLHAGAPESIGDGFVTTFKQVRHLIYDFIGSTATPDDKASLELSQENATSIQQPPVWIVVPFNGMMEGLPQGASSLSNTVQETKSTDDSLLKTTSAKSIDITKDNIPSATRDTESTTIDVQQDENLDNVETTTTTTTTDDTQNQEIKTTLDETSNVEPIPDTTSAPTVKESLEEDESHIHTDSMEPTSTSISSTVDTTETTTTDTTTMTDNSSTTTNKEEKTDSGWGTPPTPTSSLATASSAWTKGILPEITQQQQQEEQQQQKDEEEPEPSQQSPSEETQQISEEPQPTPATTTTTTTEGDTEDDSSNNGWGSPLATNKSPPAWEGKLPDDVVTPGDETISGDVNDSQWQSVPDYDKRRTMGAGRGRPSGGYRGGGSGFGQGRGGGGGGGSGYRSYGDGRGGTGMRRGRGGSGSANAGWTKARTPRPE